MNKPPPAALVIEPFGESDEAQVVALWLAVFPNVLPHHDPRASIRRKLAVQRELFFVARLADKVVGTTMAGYDGHRGWIYSVAVAPPYRRQGIARELLRHAERALAALDCPKINLQVRADNAEVIAFYERCGYAVEPIVSMGKRL